MDDNKIILVDETGAEKEFEIMLTFEEEDGNQKYVFYYDAEVDEEENIEVFVSRYDDEGNIYEITDDKELEMVEEVYNTFVDEQGLGVDEQGLELDE